MSANDRSIRSFIEQKVPFDRRHFLWNAGGGLGAIALAWMLNRESLIAEDTRSSSALSPARYARDDAPGRGARVAPKPASACRCQ